jgi:hypothetical protein
MTFGIIIISLIAVVAMLAGLVGVAIGRAPLREREGARLEPASLAEIGRLREDVDRLSAEVSRLHEEQSFIVNLLGETERKRLLEGPANDA